ncbi:uncharacterized protein LOC128956240 [Oppia nitens]|uniref:uncharacterized protein LOC128956240 n=1 Tax=Oppia nitens TaxID=1686743 RepID=UPI0023DBA3CD|nr:uncharacterized protein LOC128956240 [Oppia nitens]
MFYSTVISILRAIIVSAILLAVTVASAAAAAGRDLSAVGVAAVDNNHCYRQSRCRPLHTGQCLDVTLPYKLTTAGVPAPGLWDLNSNGGGGGGGDADRELVGHRDIHDYLSRWKGLRSVPQCWKALQSVLCATFFPRCDNDTGRVSLPTREMCRLTRHPCRLLERHHHWPEFLRCDNETLFPGRCKNDYTDLKFHAAPGVQPARCALPLVNTDDHNIWYPEIEGCAVQCLNPMFTADDRRRVATVVYYGSLAGSLATAFVVITFVIDWRSSSRWPALIIFYLNLCLFAHYAGWLMQSALHDGHRVISCRPDNTTRYGEPGNSPENHYCLLTFFLTYYSAMAALVWYANLAYAWDLLYRTSSTSTHRVAVNSKVAYFHLTAWSVPLMLTITILALGEVDGDSLRGICFVGVQKPIIRFCFVLIPLTVSVAIGCYYLIRAMITLVRVKLAIKSHNSIDLRKNKKIERMVLRIVIFMLSAWMAVAITYVYHIYEFVHQNQWKESLNEYILCTLNLKAALNPYDELSTSANTIADDLSAADNIDTTGVQKCKLVERPNLVYIYLQLIAIFAIGLVSSSWVWTANSLSGWRRFLNRRLRPDHRRTSPMRVKPDEIISKTYRNRHHLSQGGYMPSFHSMHSDPVAMNLNSAASQELSATWAGALPTFVHRRGALGHNDPHISAQQQQNHYLSNFSGTRQHSSNSDVSQQRSYDSYRRSLDSQYSLEQLEMVAMDRHQRRKTRKEREKLLKKSNPYHIRGRRGSDTSGSIVSTALMARDVFRRAVAKSECKSTSTGDLIQLDRNTAAAAAAAVAAAVTMPSHPAMTHHPIHPFMTSPICSPNSLPPLMSAASHFLPFMPPLIRPVRPPTAATTSTTAGQQQSTSFTFTHGMSDQSSQLINPLLEKRRPDSCQPPMTASGHHFVTTQNSGTGGNNSAITVQPTLNTTPNGTQTLMQNLAVPSAANYGLTYMNGLTSGGGLTPYFAAANYFGHSLNPLYGNPMTAAAAAAAAGQSQAPTAAANFLGLPYGASPLPSAFQYPPAPYTPYSTIPTAAATTAAAAAQQCANLQELQTLMREREAYLQLIRPMDSGSELEDSFLPIQLSDSEGIYSPDPMSRNEGLMTAQQIVDQHIQRVEAQAEASGAGTSGGGGGGHHFAGETTTTDSEVKQITMSSSIVGALGGHELEELHKNLGDNYVNSKSNGVHKSDSTKQRKHKKSSKKSSKKQKSSQNSCNNNNNNKTISALIDTKTTSTATTTTTTMTTANDNDINGNEESEEQKPLMDGQSND